MQTRTNYALMFILATTLTAATLPAACAEVDNKNCGDGTLNAGEECDGELLNGLDCEALGREPGELTCSVTCTLDISGCGGCANPCSTVGSTRCNGTRVESCDYGPTECLAWQSTVDCGSASQICDSSSGTAKCGAP